MTQLSYNEAFDPYHAVFRYFRLKLACEFEKPVAFDKFRILDFYLLYPFLLQNMKLFSEDTSWRSISKSYSHMKPYGELPDDHSIFERMAPFQRAAASSLVWTGVISSEAWARNEIQFANDNIPVSIRDRCLALNEQMPDVMKIIKSINERYQLNGNNGLKFRSGLLEYRYDPV